MPHIKETKSVWTDKHLYENAEKRFHFAATKACAGKQCNRHPDWPKKPLTPFFRYFLEKREKYSTENPSLPMTQLAKMLAMKFAALDEKEKQKYKDSYERESEAYKVQMEKLRLEHPEMYTDEHRGIGNEQGAKYSGHQKPHTPVQLFLAEKMMKHTNLDPYKHPDLPKKPNTPYFRYFLEKREKYSKENPSLSMTQLAKMLATKFAALGEKKKQKYKDSYERESEAYKVLMEKFRLEHPEMYNDEHRRIGNKQGAKYSGHLAEKLMKHTNLDPYKHPDLPKEPLTPYFRYFLEKREKCSKENPSLSMTELAKILSAKFAELDEKEKQKYKDSYERENEAYKVKLEKFRLSKFSN